MIKIHGRPPKPERVGNEQGFQAWENVAHEQRFHDCRAGMQGGESSKYHRRAGESRRVYRDTEELIDYSKACGTSLDAVIRWRQPIEVLIPWRRAWKQQLYAHPNDIHVPKASRENGRCSGRAEDEENTGTDSGGAEVHDSVGKPG